VCSNGKVKGARKETYFYCKTCINQPFHVSWGMFQKMSLSRTSKSFSVGPIVYRVFVVCVHRRERVMNKRKGICVYFILENSRQFEPVKHYNLSHTWLSYTTIRHRICFLASCL
jgi:hypothetical protein